MDNLYCGRRPKCSDIPDLPILEVMYLNGTPYSGWNFFFEDSDSTELSKHLRKYPYKLAMAKLRSMMKRGLIEGCACGCRGDWELEDKGLEMLKNSDEWTRITKFKKIKDALKKGEQ